MTTRHICLAVLLSLLLLTACTQAKDDVTGKYAAQDAETDVVLVLNDNGKGTWSTDLDEIQFKWSVRSDGELWLHTVEGGVVRGRISGDTVTVSLPGINSLVFKRQ